MSDGPAFRPLRPEDCPFFNKQATLDDTDDAMIKRGIVEDPSAIGKAEDGFVTGAQLAPEP